MSRDYLVHHRICPVTWLDDGTLVIAKGPTAYDTAVAELSEAVGTPVVTRPATDAEIDQLIERTVALRDRQLEMAVGADTSSLATDVRDLASQPPVIRYVNFLVRDAVDCRASDIHLEAAKGGLAVRYRIDGVLSPAPEPPSDLQQAVVSRIKLVSDLDIAERRRPQDGRIRVRLDQRELDLRVSTIPTLYGESVALRLLEQADRPVALSDLGLPDRSLNLVEQLVRRPHGMLLASGPTGSGKTTTLYSAIQSRSRESEKIVTVEDPVEYQLHGITQVQVNREAGTTFATALRAILRQDPDVLMIGEMRDQETAEIAVQAAMTGHLVFSTIHTNDAVSAIPRLIDLGVPAYLVAATLDAVLAQRLVRRICEQCRESYEPPPQYVAALSGSPVSGVRLMRGMGCGACRGTGFRGRLGLFELLVLNENMRDAISRNAARGELRDLALESGLIPLRRDGWEKVSLGLTTIEEVIRVVQT